MNHNTIGIIAGVLTSVSMIPQLLKILRKKDVKDLSYLTLLILIVGLSLWVYYGIESEEWPIILSNGFAVIINIILLSCYFIYRKK